MTHSVSGNIVVADASVGFIHEKANAFVARYMRRYKQYFSHFSSFSGIKVTKYNLESGEGRQPFISVYDRPQAFREWATNLDRGTLPNKFSPKNLMRLIEISSGSHVGVSDGELAIDIYTTAKQLRRILAAVSDDLVMGDAPDLGIELLFDDGHQFFTPRGFLSEINRHRK